MPKKSTIYSVHPGVTMVQQWIATLPEKTGRSLDQWLAVIRKKGPKGEKERREWLKNEHGLGTNTAWWLAERAENKPGADDGDPASYLRQAETYVAEMFAGKKEPLRPIYDALLELGRSVGKDVKFCPCKTIVPFYRNHVIAQVKPATQKRIDFGLALAKAKIPAKSRLIATGGAEKKDRITHKIELASADDVDGDVERWLKVAYDLDA